MTTILSAEMKEHFIHLDIGLKEELKRAVDWHNFEKVSFIKGQLDMLSKIKSQLEPNREKNFPKF
tara:strand:- start:358 stop:552 length:195 start_codon:yes stop_codon:yes gene_type:complete